MAYVITEPCIDVKDKACVEVCPVDCAYEGRDQLFIHPDGSIDGGACSSALDPRVDPLSESVLLLIAAATRGIRALRQAVERRSVMKWRAT